MFRTHRHSLPSSCAQDPISALITPCAATPTRAMDEHEFVAAPLTCAEFRIPPPVWNDPRNHAIRRVRIDHLLKPRGLHRLAKTWQVALRVGKAYNLRH